MCLESMDQDDLVELGVMAVVPKTGQEAPMATPLSDRKKMTALRELAREIGSAADAHTGYAWMSEEHRDARVHPRLPTVGEMAQQLGAWAAVIERIALSEDVRLMPELRVYVPAPGTSIAGEIPEGSALVGHRPVPWDSQSVVYCESDEGEQAATIERKLSRAADSLAKRSPTACRVVPPEDLFVVGWYDTEARSFRIEFEDDAAEEAWKAWIGQIGRREP